MRQAYEAANCVIPVSQELVDDLASFFGKAYRWQAVSNIIDTDFWSPRPSLSEEKAGFRFCCLAVANIYGKGYDVLAEALDLLPADIELHIAGRGTDSLPMQKLFGRRHGVHLHGELSKEEVRALLWQSDALVLPSRSEAQPLVLLEALATGIPVVGTECIPKSVRIPGGCLIAPVGDAKTLAEKMREVMKVQPSKEFFGAVERLASSSVVAKQLADIFKS